jgi:tetratricopeptide (TPR) repeat protein/TolB-like protein
MPVDQPPSAFAAGDLLCARFEVQRFLAQGGMGEVYEARDLELGEVVALKTIRPEVAGDPRVLQRFKREIALARRVTHPNVCRVFDLFHHPAPDGSGRSTTFLAMQMLHGETLATRLLRMGPLPTREALPLVEQMAAGLQAAHQEGIVHRDLKPGNVILVANGHGTRALLTDFGLARSADDRESVSWTGGAGLVGTSAYMSPEQVEGREVTAASDIYSLGVLMYEMVAGVKPFVGETPLATAVMRLKQAPASPRAHRPDLDARWERAILRCLAVSPADRFRSVDGIVAALTAFGPGRKLPTVGGARRSGYVLASAVAVTTVAAALASSVPGRSGGRTPSPPAAAATPRRSVALLGFKNLSGRPASAWLSTALSEMLAMELAAGETLRIIPGENVARMKVELSLSDADSLASDTLARIRANLGTDLVVLGSYLAQGETASQRLRLDVRVQETARGELVASVTETGTEAELLDFVSRGGSRLRERLGVVNPSAGPRGARASFPANTEAARLYAEGLARLRAFDALAARNLLQKAVAAEPAFPLAHAALAEAWSVLGYDPEARREAKTALDLSEGLPREERLAVEGRHHAMAAQWAKAMETYRLLWDFFPDSVEYGLRLAAAQSAGGRGQDALATLDTLRKSSADPRIDLAEAETAAALSQPPRRRTAAARAVEAGDAQGSPLLAAQARLQLAGALKELGDPAAAIEVYEETRRVFTKAGDRRGVAASLFGTAVVHMGAYSLKDAEPLFQQALTLYREIGHQGGASRALTGLANVLSLRGDHAAALAIYEQVLALDRRRGDHRAILVGLYNIGYTYRHRGEVAMAGRYDQEALSIAREIGDAGWVAGLLQAVGWGSMEQGELPQAQAALEEALALNRQVGKRGSAGQNLYNLGHLLHAMGDLDGARRRHEESMSIRLDIGETFPAMENRVRLAAILVEEDHAAEAEAMAREAVTYFQAVPDPLEEMLARIVLIRGLLAQGKVAEAQTSTQRLTTLVRKNQTRAVTLSAAIAVAEVDAASGRAPEAIRSLERTIDDARKLGLRWFELEARLALGQVEVKHGRAAAGRARLAELEKEARAKQFLLIARKAAAAG